MKVVEISGVPGDRPFAVRRQDGKLSVQRFWTRRSANIAMKLGRCTFGQ